ncbi:porin [Thiomicrorhabdus sp. 6S2-11]|uniref:Porin n=1 Tax=Thiomicrorhabdus marina TaxID=2818442 RepID=A0ABS3Q3P8_9GAMM|nr:porin [Thiomicrorhabdus marina]MBO1926951.1 porin [Thiomicrorhabdus marina]
MKKNIIALAIASAVAAPVAMADAPTVYGQLNLNYNKTADVDGSINSTASRLGIKGSEDLGNGLKAVYGVEFGLDAIADNNSDGKGDNILSQRNAFLGLAGGFGTVLMGRHDTPTKMIQPSDLFNDGAADVNQMTNGIDNGEVRADDVLAYVSPSFGGVKILAAAVIDEEAGEGAGEGNDDWVNLAATYGSTKKGLYLAAAWQDAQDDDMTVIRASAQYKAGGLVASVMHQDVSGDTAELAGTSGNFTHFQAGYKIGKFMPKVKYAMTDKDGADKETGFAVGLNYSLGKKTTAYIYTVDREDINTKGNAEYIIGMVHKF